MLFWRVGTERSRTIQAPRSLQQHPWASELRPHKWRRCFVSEAQHCLLATRALVRCPAGGPAAGARWFQSLWTEKSSSQQCFSGYLRHLVVLKNWRYRFKMRACLLRIEKIPQKYETNWPSYYVFPSCAYKQINMVQTDICTSLFTAALLTVTKAWKSPRCASAEEWVKKMKCSRARWCHSAVRKNEIMSSAAAWMDLENIRGTKRNTVWHCLYVKSKKMIQRNLFAKQK